jgi:serine/threonine protein kinase/Tfp pilus assembly protein PilF
MIGKTISHYKILEKLGEGGMGVVYKAEDLKIKRTVALKFLPPELTRDPEAKERFIQEAQAASALDHPNICVIHEIDETKPAPADAGDGQMFICMAYYDRETLKKKIVSGQLTVDSVIDIAIQIAQGLVKAHKHGIVHRDIKPGNIMIIKDGMVKILDFGLAKLAGQVGLTKTGTTVGTVSYMSPEQARGEEVDHRTDIWSFGVVLYEMVSGKLPFRGEYDQAVVYSIMNEQPEPLIPVGSGRSGVPMELESIINKCLEKKTSDRYQHVDELIVDLWNLKKKSKPGVIPSTKELKRKDRRPTSPFIIPIIFLLFSIVVVSAYFIIKGKKTEKPELKSIAVLPFANLRSDPDTDFLSYALADRVIGALAYIKSISVRASSSIRKYENQVVDALSAGNDLKVNYILAGNYLKQANYIRLSVELVNVYANEMIWRESIEVQYENAFTLQDIVSEKVTRGLRIHFSEDERDRMRKDVPQNPLAYEFYLRSISYPLSIEGHSLAIEVLKQSIQLDSNYAPAFCELGYRTDLLGQSALGAAEEYNKSEQFYLKALSLNSQLLSALTNLSGHYTDVGRNEKAMDLARQALKINPNNAWTHFILSYIYRYAGMLNESEQEVEKALTFHPNNPRFRSVGLTYLYLGKYKKALEAFDLDKGSVFALRGKGTTFLREGQRSLAIDCFNRILELEPEGQSGLNVAGIKAYLEGNNEEGLRTTHRWEQEATYDAETLYGIAINYSLLGDKAGCVRVLRKAVDGGFFNYPFMLRDPFLDPVRDDLEFQRVLAMAKTKHEAFRKRFFSN